MEINNYNINLCTFLNQIIQISTKSYFFSFRFLEIFINIIGKYNKVAKNIPKPKIENVS